MAIDLSRLSYTFQHKPLLIGGRAMEHYGLRKSGDDADFVIAKEDYDNLSLRYPGHRKDLFGDLGVCIEELELWRTIVLFDYAFLARGALETETIKIIALDRLLFLKALALNGPKDERDGKLIAAKIQAIQYGKDPDYPADFFARRG